MTPRADPAVEDRVSGETSPRARKGQDVDAVELLAGLLAEKLDAYQRSRTGWVSADTVAAHLSVEVSYVYDHAGELGAVRLGDGPRARLRFRLDLVDEALTFSAGRGSEEAGSRAAAPIARRRRTAATPSARSLPVRPIWDGPHP